MIKLLTFLITSLCFQTAFAQNSSDPNLQQYNQGATGYAAPHDGAKKCDTCAKDQSQAAITPKVDHSLLLADSEAPTINAAPVKNGKGADTTASPKPKK